MIVDYVSDPYSITLHITEFIIHFFEFLFSFSVINSFFPSLISALFILDTASFVIILPSGVNSTNLGQIFVNRGPVTCELHQIMTLKTSNQEPDTILKPVWTIQT